MMDQRERRVICEKVDVCDLLLNVADDIKEQFLPLYTYDVDMWYLMTRLTYGIGAYASKASNLQEFARMNHNGDIESIVEDEFYNKEHGFTVSEIRQVIAITAYFTIYHMRGVRCVLDSFIRFYSRYMRKFIEDRNMWKVMEMRIMFRMNCL